MKKIGDFVVKNKVAIIIVSCLLLIPALIGIYKTRINYDVLVYLPDDIETMKGQDILTEDFDMGAFATVVVENMSSYDILKLEKKIKKVDGVEKVVSLSDLTGTAIPKEMLPSEIVDKVSKDNSELMLITFADSTSSDETLSAVETIRNMTDDSTKIGGMTAMVLDTMNLSNQEIVAYIIIAVMLCMIVLMLALDSYFASVLLLANIGVAILYNMGTNIFLGEISYITKAISAVLQLGVTTDFSIFLYHKFESAKKKEKDKEKAMSNAISETLVSVLGSSLTTIAGFLALCTMNLTLGRDIGIVMAKGVLMGLICVVTLFPSLILFFDERLEKRKHKPIIPEFNHVKSFVLKHYKKIFIVFLLLIIPTWYGNKNVKVYYNLDRTLPSTLPSSIANTTLKDKYNIVSPEMVLVSSSLKNSEIQEMVSKIKKLEGIDLVLSASELSKLGIPEEMIDEDLKSIYKSDKYQMIFIDSIYATATDELNAQVDELNSIVKKYDKNAIVAGEGALMKDLVEISDQDFHNVNYTSIVVILIIMLFVLKSFSLPVLLVCGIEFAIFVNMSVPYYMGSTLPFIASIVIGTIQLGATIDYAILMTTKYLEVRKKEKNKHKAMKVALDNSVNSIFVSGLCFFAATFGVGVYSKLEMIGSICSLIARGAIISMIVVVVILPSILLLFDGLIIKTTKGFKKETKKMKNVKKLSIFLILTAFLASTSNVSALTKNETVYSKLNNDGAVKNIIVSEQLKNTDNEDTINDVTNLKEILNINGNEKYKLDGTNLVWDAKGKDIYYQGETNNDLPVSLNISYKLNGKDIKLKKLLGKKGKVTIKLKYTNHDSHVVDVNGKYTTLYTPFVVTLGTIISNDENSNIEVTNGKVISNGTNSVVVAVASPGLYESLGINQLKDFDTITITFDTTNFSLSSMYSVISSNLISEDNLKVFDKLDTVYSKVDTLTSASNQLVNGSNKILEGANKLSLGAEELSTGINKAYNGSVTLSSGLNAMLETTKNSTVSVEEIVNEAVDKTNKSITNPTTEKELEEKENTTNQILAICSAYASSQEKLYSCASQIGALILEKSEKVASEVSESVATPFVEGTQTTIKALTQLSEGSNSLTSGLSELDNGAKTLKDGTNTLTEGIKTLTEGITKFDSEGIDSINNLVNGDLKTLGEKIKALIKLGNAYDTFTMKDSNTDGSTKFVLLVDKAQKTTKAKTAKTDTKKSENKSLLDKIKNLF